ncbi:FABP family protein [Kocuria sp. WRN011]|uniref:Peroxynitrite isomerase n=1 Tax=Kocuria carniphila TaxID=262208 RepID=A0ABV3V5Q9_9MICC|nr:MULTISPECIES: FABP family protein [Kocuria]MCT1802737.1 FABP family protein [Kocuria carniphila]PBB09914.1 FABP family protein [Kocuria sp. WRN011]PZP36192.1 MAG: FABP family protein [Kocuria rhizophila]
MPVEIPTNLTPELVPFAWLLGTWEGDGFVGYGDAEQRAFRQRVTFEQHGLPFVIYRAQTTLLNEEGESQREATYEQGFWELARPREDGDIGPGMLPPDPVPVLKAAQDVEDLRNADGGFDISVSMLHPGGISELYLGQIKGPRVDLATDAVMRAQGSKEYASGTRLYGLVNGNLMWAWDMAANGHELATHASAELKKVDPQQ